MTTHPDLSSSQREMREGVFRALRDPMYFQRQPASVVRRQAEFLVAGPIASALAALERENATLRADLKAAEGQNEALHVKLAALAPHGSCACSYDKPDDVCSHHSPAITAAEAELATLRASAERMEAALKFYGSPVSYALALQAGQRIPVLDDNGDTARAALTPKETPDA